MRGSEKRNAEVKSLSQQDGKSGTGPGRFGVALMLTAGLFALPALAAISAFSSYAKTDDSADKMPYASLDACLADIDRGKDVLSASAKRIACVDGLDRAMKLDRDAPLFSSMDLCEVKFGMGNCRENSDRKPRFRPQMMGYSVDGAGYGVPVYGRPQVSG